MKFSDPHRLAVFWRTTIIDERIKQLEAGFTARQIAGMKRKAGIR